MTHPTQFNPQYNGEATMQTIPIVETVTTVTGVSIALSPAEATLLRNLLGGLKQKTRRGAIRKNGGTKEQAEAGNALASDLFKRLEADGFKKFGEPSLSATSTQEEQDEYGDDYDPYEDEEDDAQF